MCLVAFGPGSFLSVSARPCLHGLTVVVYICVLDGTRDFGDVIPISSLVLPPFIACFVVADVDFVPSSIISILVSFAGLALSGSVKYAVIFMSLVSAAGSCLTYSIFSAMYSLFFGLGSVPSSYLACFVSVRCLGSSSLGVSADF